MRVRAFDFAVHQAVWFYAAGVRAGSYARQGVVQRGVRRDEGSTKGRGMRVPGDGVLLARRGEHVPGPELREPFPPEPHLLDPAPRCRPRHHPRALLLPSGPSPEALRVLLLLFMAAP
eukprot:49601-Rhodomonas_salina.1